MAATVADINTEYCFATEGFFNTLGVGAGGFSNAGAMAVEALTVNGSTILGDAATDTVTINAGPVILAASTSASDALQFGTGANLANLYRSAADTLKTDDAFVVAGTLGVTGAATLSSTLGVTGAATLSSTLGVTGLATFAVAGGIKVNETNGVAITSLIFGTLAMVNGETSKALTLTGVTASSKIIATTSAGNVGNKTILTAVPTTNTVTVTMSGDVGGNTSIDILAIN